MRSLAIIQFKLIAILLCAVIISCSNNNIVEDLFLIKSGNQYGYINKEGKVVITPQFDGAKDFGNSPLAPYMIDGKWGYINRSGDIVVAAQYQMAGVFSEDGMAPVKQQDGLWGYLNEKGEIAIAAQYLHAFPFKEEHAIVVIDSSVKLGVIDIDGRLTLLTGHVSPTHFNATVFGNGAVYEFEDSVFSVSDGFDLTNLKDTIGYYSREVYYNYQGEIIGWENDFHWRKTDNIQYKNIVEDFLQNEKNCYGEKNYQHVSDPSEGVMRVKKNDKWGLINVHGDIIIDPIWDDCNNYNDGISIVERNGKYGAINLNGDVVVDIIYDYLQDFSEGLATATKDNKCGVIDKKGDVIVPFKYDWIGKYEQKFAPFVQNEKTGIINTKGEVVVEPQYYGILNYRDAIFVVSNDDFEVACENGGIGVINSRGEIIVPFKYRAVVPCGFRTIWVRGNGNGLINYNGEWIIPMEGKEIDTQNMGELLLAIVDGKWHYINNEGKIVWKDETIKITKPQHPWDVLDPSEVCYPEKNKGKYMDFFESRTKELNIIEGLYYVYCKKVIKNFYSGQIKVTSFPTTYWAIYHDPRVGYEYTQFGNDPINEDVPPGTNYFFNEIGKTNSYAITTDYGDGKLVIDNPLQLHFTIEYGHNDYCIGYYDYELIRDYPTSDMLEGIGQSEWSGTGFAIDNGYLATNYHVVNGAKRISIIDYGEDDNKRYNAQIVAFDDKNDLAILKIIDSKFDEFSPIPYTFKSTISDVGEEVFVLGYPMTETMGEEIKLTTGVISSTKGYQDNNALYQISTPIQPGNSGGPLFDSNGDVIGVVCAKHKDAENAGYAVKMIYLENLIKSNNLSISLSKRSKVHSKSLPKKVKKLKGFVYKIECSN